MNTLSFNEMTEDKVRDCGSLAQALCKMREIGRIPNGFIITIQALSEFARMGGNKIPWKIELEILGRYKDLGNRSVWLIPSFSIEKTDFKTLSAHNKMQLLEEIRGLWSSFLERGEEAAIVVEKLIESESFGYILTRDIEGEEGRITIQARFGLPFKGETFDEYHLGHDLTTKEKEIIEQVKQFVLGDSKLVEVEIAEELRKNQKLSDEEMRTLAAIAKNISKTMKTDVKVLWCLEGKDFYLMAAQPIVIETKVPREIAPAKEEVFPETYAPTTATKIFLVVESLEDIEGLAKLPVHGAIVTIGNLQQHKEVLSQKILELASAFLPRPILLRPTHLGGEGELEAFQKGIEVARMAKERELPNLSLVLPSFHTLEEGEDMIRKAAKELKPMTFWLSIAYASNLFLIDRLASHSSLLFLNLDRLAASILGIDIQSIGIDFLRTKNEGLMKALDHLMNQAHEHKCKVLIYSSSRIPEDLLEFVISKGVEGVSSSRQVIMETLRSTEVSEKKLLLRGLERLKG